VIYCASNEWVWEDCRVASLLGNGDGSFLQPKALPRACGRTYRDIEPGDFNGDGALDLVALTGPTEHAITLWLGHGDGTFDAPREVVRTNDPDEVLRPELLKYTNTHGILVPNRFEGGKASALYVAMEVHSVDADYAAGVFDGHGQGLASDFDGDGKDDILSWVPFGKIELKLGSKGWGSDAILLPPSDEHGYPLYPRSGVTTDVNGDGRMDFIAMLGHETLYEGFLATYLGNGQGGFDAPRLVQTALKYAEHVEVYFGDLNGDSALDVLTIYSDTYGLNRHRMWTFLGDGQGGFTEIGYLVPPSAAMAMGDLNGDSVTDIVIGNGWGIIALSGSALIALVKP
jgi:hypothetical protein